MSTAQLSFNGLVGAAEAIVETARHLHEIEEHYHANEASFTRLQEQFQQIQESATQLQSLTEERLAAVNSLNTELKARHSQSEQALAEVKSVLEECKKALAEGENRSQADGDRSSQLAQTVAVIRTIVEQLQSRQSQLEQSQIAAEALIADLGKRNGEQAEWKTLRNLVEQISERQGQGEKALSAVQASQQAEKGLLEHFEKSLNGFWISAADLEKRQAQIELTLASFKANGNGDAAVQLQSLDTVRGLMQDVGNRQTALQGLIEEVQNTVTRTAEQAAQVGQQIVEVQKTSLQAIAESEAAGAMAAKAMEQNSFLESLRGPEGDPAAAANFQRFLERCEEAHKAAITEHKAKLDAEFQEQVQQALERVNKEQRPPIHPEWVQNVEATVTGHHSELRFVRTLLWITLAAVGLAYGLVAYAVILR